MPKSKHRRNGKARPKVITPVVRITCVADNPRVVAIHEAGHAVGRFITCEEMGLAPEDAVSEIIMVGNAGGSALNACYGPLFTQEIIPFIDSVGDVGNCGDTLFDRRAVDIAKTIVAAARAAGCDITKWAKAIIVIALAGPVAEAKAIRCDVLRIIGTSKEPGPGGGDMRLVEWTSELSGMSEPDCCQTVQWALDRLYAAYADPVVWQSLLRLADALPVRGSMSGARAYEIYSQTYRNRIELAA